MQLIMKVVKPPSVIRGGLHANCSVGAWIMQAYFTAACHSLGTNSRAPRVVRQFLAIISPLMSGLYTTRPGAAEFQGRTSTRIGLCRLDLAPSLFLGSSQVDVPTLASAEPGQQTYMRKPTGGTGGSEESCLLADVDVVGPDVTVREGMHLVPDLALSMRCSCLRFSRLINLIWPARAKVMQRT